MGSDLLFLSGLEVQVSYCKQQDLETFRPSYRNQESWKPASEALLSNDVGALAFTNSHKSQIELILGQENPT